MTITVVKKGTIPDPTYAAKCRHCNSELEAKREDLTFYPGAFGEKPSLLAHCPVCEKPANFKLKG